MGVSTSKSLQCQDVRGQIQQRIVVLPPSPKPTPSLLSCQHSKAERCGLQILQGASSADSQEPKQTFLQEIYNNKSRVSVSSQRQSLLSVPRSSKRKVSPKTVQSPIQKAVRERIQRETRRISQQFKLSLQKRKAVQVEDCSSDSD